jgi:hypothetical protein
MIQTKMSDAMSKGSSAGIKILGRGARKKAINPVLKAPHPFVTSSFPHRPPYFYAS